MQETIPKEAIKMIAIISYCMTPISLSGIIKNLSQKEKQIIVFGELNEKDEPVSEYKIELFCNQVLEIEVDCFDKTFYIAAYSFDDIDVSLNYTVKKPQINSCVLRCLESDFYDEFISGDEHV